MEVTSHNTTQWFSQVGDMVECFLQTKCLWVWNSLLSLVNVRSFNFQFLVLYYKSKSQCFTRLSIGVFKLKKKEKRKEF